MSPGNEGVSSVSAASARFWLARVKVEEVDITTVAVVPIDDRISLVRDRSSKLGGALRIVG